MKMPIDACRVLWLLALGCVIHGAEVPDDLTGDEWVAAHAKAAEEDFAKWKATGTVPETFKDHAVRGERADLIERLLAGDRLAETELKPETPPLPCEVALRDSMPVESEGGTNSQRCTTVWRRITKDRFEIWTPGEGKMFDVDGKLVARAKVRRGDGWGREWYGAFLPDGRWVTTDLDERDDRLTMFSANGRRLWSIRGGTLVPEKMGKDEYPSLPLIAWARSARDGKAWVVSVGSEFGRGWVKVTPDGKWSEVSCPWKECLPQQLGPRGMYTCKSTKSDDGGLTVMRSEPGHGVMVGWPTYEFPEGANTMIPDGGKFGILPDAWAVFIEAYSNTLNATPEERKPGHVWFFDAKGTYSRWIKGRLLGASLVSGGIWVGMPDGGCVRVDKGFTAGPHMVFVTKDKKPLIPLELHDDIGLGLFLLDEQLALGTWKAKP